MSLFITFEGGEGCGKSTQAKRLSKRLSDLGFCVVLTHEPGDTSLGREIRHQLKRKGAEISPLTELLLFASSRAQLVTQVIRPNLNKGAVVISDRYADSTAAYQGYGRGLDLSLVQTINSIATQGLLPYLVVFLDIPAEIGLDRKPSAKRDRFEGEGLDFHRKVREGYLKMAKSDPERWLVVDATLSKGKVEQLIWERVKQLVQGA